MASLTITRGDAERLKALVTPASAAATGLRFMAKYRHSDPDASAVLDKSVGSGISIIDPGSGSTPAEAQITIDPLDLEDLPNRATRLIYELEDGEDHSLDTGDLIVKPKVILDELS